MNHAVTTRATSRYAMQPKSTWKPTERKLFIGMLPKQYGELQVRQLLATFGAIEECTILKDINGQSKGCAFVTFASRLSASTAIKAMNQTVTLEVSFINYLIIQSRVLRDR